ncbi:hypothetical protein TcG_12983 [Trypanosoma cruzi]|nr:hypothetical protein TcG_12983 [Trypanosoma cruzi]
MGAVPPRQKIPGNSPMPRVARATVSLCLRRLFFQTRTRPHHTPVKTFGPSHAKDWSERTAGKATPATMSSPHTPTHRCPAYHQKQKYQRNMPHPNNKSQVRLQHTLPPPGRVRPLAARRSNWDHQKHQFGSNRPPPQQSRSPLLTKAKACSGAADGGTHSRRVMDCRGNHAAAMRPSFGKPKKKHVSRSPREQHILNRIQLHYCGRPHSQHECDNAGQEARNNTTHPSHKGPAASVLPSTIIPPHITLLHIRSKKAHTVHTKSGVPKEQAGSSECCRLLNVG